MTGSDLKRAVEAVGNGGAWAAAYRISVWVFCTLIGIIGYFAMNTLTRIENNQTTFVTAISQLQATQGVHATQIEDLRDRTEKRYTADQAIADWRAQDRRDSAQDKDRERLERRVETELRRLTR